MKQAFFYLLTDIEPDFNTCQLIWQENKQIKLTQREELTCWLAFRYFQTRKRVLIFCEDKVQAERLDEALWTYQPQRFIAHQLVTEAKNAIAPIEIGWPGQRGSENRDLLIYLASDFSDVTAFFKSVIDFVPAADSEKESARVRYKQFRDMGFHLKTGQLPEKFVLDSQE